MKRTLKTSLMICLSAFFVVGKEFRDEAARVQMIDTASGDLVFSKRLLLDQQEFQTTSDGKYGIAYRDDFGYGKDTRIFVYDMPLLLSRCRFGGK